MKWLPGMRIDVQMDNRPQDALVENKSHSFDGDRIVRHDPSCDRNHIGYEDIVKPGDEGRIHGSWGIDIQCNPPYNDHCKNIENIWYWGKQELDEFVQDVG